MTEAKERPIPRGIVKRFQLRRDLRRADVVAQKAEKKKLITHPIARFNLNLDNQNPDWEARDGTKSPAHVKKEETTSLEKIKDPETGQTFKSLKLNWEQFVPGESRVLVFMPSVNNKVQLGATNYRIDQLGRQIDLPILAINYPGMGSQWLTKEQKTGLADDLSYGPIAEAELRAMREMGITEVDLVGQSLGGFVGIEFARKAKKYGIIVKNLIVVESPGEEELTSKELTKRVIHEGNYIDLYQSRPFDDEMFRSLGLHRSTPRRMASFVLWLIGGIIKDKLGHYSSPVTQAAVGEMLEDALASNPEMNVVVAHGTLSTISPSNANAELVETPSEKYPGRISRAVFPGEPHTVMEPAKRFASFVKTIVKR